MSLLTRLGRSVSRSTNLRVSRTTRGGGRVGQTLAKRRSNFALAIDAGGGGAALAAPLSFSRVAPLLRRAAAVPVAHPLAFGMVFTGAKTALADWMVQKCIEEREQLDRRRTLSFGVYGLLYLGGFQWWLYCRACPKWFPGTAEFVAKPLRARLRDTWGQRQVLKFWCFDQFVYGPLLYWPAFYVIKECVQGGGDIRAALQLYRRNATEDVYAGIQFWGPVAAINYTVMPMYARIPFVGAVSLVWCCILSFRRGRGAEEGDIEEL